MLCYNVAKYDSSLRVAMQMRADKFFLDVIAVFFDSNSQGTNFDVSPTQRFYSK